MSINFYQLYKLLNEYGQNLVQSLIQKFQKEDPALTPEIIKIYVDKFEKIKNNLAEKDINKYSWKELESVIDSRQPKQRIKAGKLDPTVTDANLLYNKDGIRIYIGKDKKSCIKYSNGYNFCIGARGEDNMYNYYRIGRKGTPYFIFNDNLPKNNEHLLVLFVYDNKFLPPTRYPKETRYSLTDAYNDGEKDYERLSKIIKDYPWLKPLEQFIDDNKKGTIEAEPSEIIEYIFSNAFFNKKSSLEVLYKHGSDYITYGERGLQNLFLSLKNLIFEKDPLTIKNFIEQKNNQKVAFVRIYESNKDNSIFMHPRMLCVFCKNSEELLVEIKKIAKRIIKEPSLGAFGLGKDYFNQTISQLQPLTSREFLSILKPIEENKNKIYEILNENKELKDTYIWNLKNNFDDAIILPYFLIQVNDIEKIALDVIEENIEIISESNNIKTKYYKYLALIKTLNKEQQDSLLEKIKKIAEDNNVKIDQLNFPITIMFEAIEEFFNLNLN